MLESDIKAVYSEMADSDLPPATISIPAVTRRGRVRLRLHRSAIIAAPVFAAAAVLAIALSVTLPGSGLSSGQTAIGPSGPAPSVFNGPAPSEFNPLVPFAAFGWLPDHESTQVGGLFARTDLILYGKGGFGPGSTSLNLHAAGHCHVSSGTLQCNTGPGGPALAPSGQLVVQVGRVSGQPAYWLSAANGGAFKYQYAPGGWAILSAPSLGTALRIAANMRFGVQAAEQSIRFPFQLTGLPAGWQVNFTYTSWLHGVQYANTFGVTASTTDDNIGDNGTDPEFDAGVGAANACADFELAHSQVINGHTVLLGSSGPVALCAADADGVFLTAGFGTGWAASYADMFAHNIKLLGPDPANWTTEPVK
jgi:hypothetical protein